MLTSFHRVGRPRTRLSLLIGLIGAGLIPASILLVLIAGQSSCHRTTFEVRW